MSSGFKIQDKDLEVLYEIKRNGTSAKFGGSVGKYIGNNGDLYNRFASFPAGFGYATKPLYSSLSPYPYSWPGFDGTYPSRQGFRPNYVTEQIVLSSPGTWQIWRDEANKRLAVKNPSGTTTYYSSSTYWEQNVPPHVMICKMVGGGGGGGSGDWFTGGVGGSGGAGWYGWVNIPSTSQSPLTCVVGGVASESRVTHSPSGQYAKCGGGTKGANASTKTVLGGTFSGNLSGTNGGTFKSVSGGHGGRPGNSYKGGSVSVGSFNISPETNVPSWSHSYGTGGGGGGSGGASMLANGGSRGGNINGGPPGNGTRGSGGGGGTWIVFKGQSGASGSNGLIVLSY